MPDTSEAVPYVGTNIYFRPVTVADYRGPVAVTVEMTGSSVRGSVESAG